MARPSTRRSSVNPQPLREPRFAALWATLVYAGCTLALVYPMLGGAFLVNPHSDYRSGHAYRVFGQQILHATGDFAQWNSLIAGGVPFIAGQHGDTFYPTFLLREVMSAAAAFNLSMALHLFLAGFFTYRFLRAWGLSFYSALFGGLAYMLAGQVASLVSPGHDGKLYVSALSPLVLWMIVRGVRDGRIWAFGVLAVAGGLAILSPHFQLTYYLAMLAGGFTAYLAFAERPDGTRLSKRERWQRLGYAAVAGALGIGIAAVHFLPLLEYIPFSPRAGGVTYEYATSYAMPPIELLNAYLPQFSGILDSYWGENPLKLHSEYLGVVVLILAGAAIGSGRHRSFVRFWLIAGGVALLVAFGGHTPFYRLWFLLPMIKVTRAPGMIYFIVSLAVAALAAVGLERFLTSAEPRPKYLLGWGIGVGVITLLGVSGGLEALSQSLALPGRLEAVAANASAVQLGALRSLLFAGIAIAVLWMLGTRRLVPSVAAWLLIGAAALDNITIDRQYFLFSPSAKQLYAPDAAIEYLQKIPEPGRTIAALLAEQNFEDPYLNGDGLMIHGVRTVTSHQAQEPQTWVDLAGAKSPALPVNAFRSAQFRRIANVRYLLTNVDLPASIPGIPDLHLAKRLGPVTNSVGTPVYLYEILENNPVAWVTPVAVTAPPDQIRAAVLDPRLNLSAVALVDSTSKIPTRTVSVAPAPSDIQVSAPKYDPGHMILELSKPAAEGNVLVVSENWFPGWNAKVDGVSTPASRVDHTLIGVPLHAGARRVELTFKDPAYLKGRVITLIALVLSAALIAFGVAAARKPSAQAVRV